MAKGHPLSERLNRVFDKAFLNSKLFENPASMKWSKMLTNLLAGVQLLEMGGNTPEEEQEMVAAVGTHARPFRRSAAITQLNCVPNASGWRWSSSTVRMTPRPMSRATTCSCG